MLVWLAVLSRSAGTDGERDYTDPQGTPLATADEQGNVIEKFDYAPYGSIALGAAPTGPGYTGHTNDPDTGLVYMQARYYDPVTARVLSVDPKAVKAADVFNFNRYAYANNNPIGNIDPDGRVVTSLNGANNAALQNYINANASGTFAFIGDTLVRTGSGEGSSGRSQYYSDRLAAAIASPTNIILDIAQTHTSDSGNVIDVSKTGGGLTEPRLNGDINVTITGDSNTNALDANGAAMTSGPKDILMHELVGHAIPMATTSDTGNAISNENKARAQIPGSSQRQADPAHVEGQLRKPESCGLLCSK